jgi:hypothetical protein
MVLYWCETWSVTSREEYRQRVFENRVVRKILGPRRDEVMGGCRKLQSDELRNLYSSTSIISDEVKEDEIGQECSTMGEKRNTFRLFDGEV